jgi:hypothetical protein
MRADRLMVVAMAAAVAAGATHASPAYAQGNRDLQGLWQALNTAVWNIQDHNAELGVPAGQGIVEGNEIPYRPEALKQREANRQNRAADPESKCWMVGVPRIMYMPFPIEIVQTPQQITILSEYAHTVRRIYMNSEHPEGEAGDIEWFMGDSRAKWDGDTLVVDNVHFTGETWFDRSGNFHSNALHVVERFTRRGPDHLLYEATIEDPKTFTRPWKISFPLYRRIERNARLLEYECPAMLELQKDQKK